MGFYINPPGMAKEQFLHEVGYPLPGPPTTHRVDVPVPMLAVCFVDNGAFTAAGIAYSQEELQAFQSPLDNRHKRWFYVAVEDLKPYLAAWVLEGLKEEKAG